MSGDPGLALDFRKQPIQLIRKPLAIGIVERRRPAGALAGAAQLVEVIAQRKVSGMTYTPLRKFLEETKDQPGE